LEGGFVPGSILIDFWSGLAFGGLLLLTKGEYGGGAGGGELARGISLVSNVAEYSFFQSKDEPGEDVRR
jgi:hypothetical protein